MNKKLECIIVCISLFFYNCSTSKQNLLKEEDKLYTEVFCALMKAKHNFHTPNNVSMDTLYIVDKYYMDTASIYYNQMNVMFEVAYVDSINFPSHKGGPEHWDVFQKFSAQRNVKNHHNISASCLDTMKIKFVSEEDVASLKQKHRIFLYSPIIPLKKGYYEIYEHSIPGPTEYYYAYIFKQKDNHSEFIKRRYYSELFWEVKEDYMKTINFSQSHEEYMDGNK